MNRTIRKLLYLGKYPKCFNSYSFLNRRIRYSNQIHFKFEINPRFSFWFLIQTIRSRRWKGQRWQGCIPWLRNVCLLVIVCLCADILSSFHEASICPMGTSSCSSWNFGSDRIIRIHCSVYQLLHSERSCWFYCYAADHCYGNQWNRWLNR